MSEDLSWAVGRTEGPQRKDCSLGLLRKRKKKKGLGREPVPEGGIWCSPQLTDLVRFSPVSRDRFYQCLSGIGEGLQ